MTIAPVAPISPEAFAANGVVSGTLTPSTRSFGQILRDGIANTEAKVTEADRMAKAFVLDDNIPVHQVTFALESARLSLELMLQVRSKLIEGYQQITTMQI